MRVLRNGIAVIEGDTHISKWVEMSGRLDHDRAVLPLLDEYLTGTVVDVGAFIGDHTEYYANRAPRVVALEPNPAAFACLAHNMQRHPNVTCIHAGASDTDGFMGIIQAPNAGASRPVADGAIRTTTIDQVATDVSFIKIDCEGYEPKVLAGAHRVLTVDRPALLIEINEGALALQGYTPADVFGILDGYGYTYRNIHKGHGMTGPQYDIICTTVRRAITGTVIPRTC